MAKNSTQHSNSRTLEERIKTLEEEVNGVTKRIYDSQIECFINSHQDWLKELEKRIKKLEERS